MKSFLLCLALTFNIATMARFVQFEHCFDYSQFRAPEKMDFEILLTVCDFLDIYGYTYTHHSDFRASLFLIPPRTTMALAQSYHGKGMALDFSLHPNPKMSRLERLEGLLRQYEDLKEYLELWGLADKVGWGIYPGWNRPGWHLDSRGHKARWGQIVAGGVYVGFDTALKWAENEVDRLKILEE